jgi:hypothetical protein
MNETQKLLSNRFETRPYSYFRAESVNCAQEKPRNRTITEPEAAAAQKKVAEINEEIKWQQAGDWRTPAPPVIAKPKRAPTMPPIISEQTGLSLPELGTRAQTRLTVALNLIDSSDNEYRTKFLRDVLTDVKDDVIIMLARLDKPANGA